MEESQSGERRRRALAGAGALCGCVLVGALATGIPFAFLRRVQDPLSSPFQPLIVYVAQALALGAVWAVCLSRRFSWMSQEWSPWAVGFLGSLAAFLLLGTRFVVAGLKEPATIRHVLPGLFYLFWFWGWHPTFALGFFGGALVGAAGLRSRRRPR